MKICAKKQKLSFLRPGCYGNLRWWNLKELTELANLTVHINHMNCLVILFLVLAGFFNCISFIVYKLIVSICPVKHQFQADLHQQKYQFFISSKKNNFIQMVTSYFSCTV